MLYNNNSYLNSIRTFCSREGSDAFFNKRNGMMISNAYFGGATSFPQGYNNQYAAIMPIKTGYMIAVIMRGEGAMAGQALIREEGVAVMHGVGTLITFAVTKESDESLMAGVGNFTSVAQVEEVLRAVIDAGARPSAFDIAQEVWGGLAVDYNGENTMGRKLNSAASSGDPWEVFMESGISAKEAVRLLLAYVAGKTLITDLGGGNATVKFRDINDTKDRISATMNESERTSIILNKD